MKGNIKALHQPVSYLTVSDTINLRDESSQLFIGSWPPRVIALPTSLNRTRVDSPGDLAALTEENLQTICARIKWTESNVGEEKRHIKQRSILPFFRASSHIRVRLGAPVTASLTFL